MRAWQYSRLEGKLEESLQLSDFPDIEPSNLKEDEIIVKVLAVGLNPADYKVPEMNFIMRRTIGTPAVPGTDFAGTISSTHPSNSNPRFRPGQLVFGRLEPLTRIGTLGENCVANIKGVVPIPDGVTIDQAAALGTAAFTSHQSLTPYVKAGDKVFINGGSGGTGTYSIQIAKALGAHVTTTCSTANIAFVRELGADEIIDYRTTSVIQYLGRSGQMYDHVVDNVGDQLLYRKADIYMKPAASFIQVGLPSGKNNMYEIAVNSILPTCLGGGSRPYKFLMMSTNLPEAYEQLGEWVKIGKVSPVIEKIFEFNQVPEALAVVRAGRVRGKIVVRVA